MDHLVAKPATGVANCSISDHQRRRNQQYHHWKRDASGWYVYITDCHQRHWWGYILNVRQATEQDLDKYIELLGHFHAASPMTGVADFDAVKTRAFLATSLENSNILLLVGELDGEFVGVTSCLMYPL